MKFTIKELDKLNKKLKQLPLLQSLKIQIEHETLLEILIESKLTTQSNYDNKVNQRLEKVLSEMKELKLKDLFSKN